MILPVVLEERHVEMIGVTATYPSWSGYNDQLPWGKVTRLLGYWEQSGLKHSKDLLLVLFFLFLHGEIKSMMWNSKANLNHFS